MAMFEDAFVNLFFLFHLLMLFFSPQAFKYFWVFIILIFWTPRWWVSKQDSWVFNGGSLDHFAEDWTQTIWYLLTSPNLNPINSFPFNSPPFKWSSFNSFPFAHFSRDSTDTIWHLSSLLISYIRLAVSLSDTMLINLIACCSFLLFCVIVVFVPFVICIQPVPIVVTLCRE